MKAETRAALDDWASYIESTRPVDDRKAITVAELKDRKGVSTSAARNELLRLVSEGKAYETTKKGTRGFVKAYRLGKKSK